MCREGVEIVSKGGNGFVTYGIKVGDKITRNEREIKHVPIVPDQLGELVLWMQDCHSSSNCDVADELSDIISVVRHIDLGDGAWRYQLSQSRQEPTLGTLIYFFVAGEASRDRSFDFHGAVL